MPGRVEYYYAEVDTWHTTHADSVEVFYFASGQTEAHHPSGLKARPGSPSAPGPLGLHALLVFPAQVLPRTGQLLWRLKS